MIVIDGEPDQRATALPFVCLEDYERAARRALPSSVYDWIEGGSGRETTVRANRTAFEGIRIWPRVLVDVSRCDVSTSVLGTPIDFPVMLAPLGCQGLVHPEGECATALAAAASGAVMTVPVMGSRSLEDVAAATSAPLWFQLYAFRDRGLNRRLVRRAATAGYRAVVLTVDAPRLGWRDRDLRRGFGLPPTLGMPNLDAGAVTPFAGGPPVRRRWPSTPRPRLTLQ